MAQSGKSGGAKKASASKAKSGGAARSSAAKSTPRSSAAKSTPRSSAAKSTGRSSAAKAPAAKSSAAKSTAAKSTTAKSPAAKRSAAAKKGAATKSASARKSAAAKGGQARARKQTAAKAASGTSRTAAAGARKAGVEAKTVAEFRDALRKNLIKPMEMVLISRERIEEALGEAVDQGRVTRRDAQRISAGLVKRGQKQTSDVLKDLESLLERGRGEIEGGARKAAGGARKRAAGARSRAVRTASPALAQVDRVRRGAGVGPNFPILGYEDLNASQIAARLKELTPAQLRKVRDHEKRGEKRKTILSAIEGKLGR